MRIIGGAWRSRAFAINLIIYAFAASSSSGMLAGQNIMIKGASIGELMFAGLLPVPGGLRCAATPG